MKNNQEELLNNTFREKHNERLNAIAKDRKKEQWATITKHKELTMKLEEDERMRDERIKKQVQLKLDAVAELG